MKPEQRDRPQPGTQHRGQVVWITGAAPGRVAQWPTWAITTLAANAATHTSADRATQKSPGTSVSRAGVGVPGFTGAALSADPNATFPLILVSGLVLVFDRCAPDRTGCLQSPNWRPKIGGQDRGSVFKDLTEQIIRAVRDGTG